MLAVVDFQPSTNNKYFKRLNTLWSDNRLMLLQLFCGTFKLTQAIYFHFVDFEASSCRYEECVTGELESMCEKIDENADQDDDPTPSAFRIVATTDQVSRGDELLESRCWLLCWFGSIFGLGRFRFDETVFNFTFSDIFVSVRWRCYQRPRKRSYQWWHLSLISCLSNLHWKLFVICQFFLISILTLRGFRVVVASPIIIFENIYYSIVVWRWSCSCCCFLLTSQVSKKHLSKSEFRFFLCCSLHELSRSISVQLRTHAD